jgi:hypothetical protein
MLGIIGTEADNAFFRMFLLIFEIVIGFAENLFYTNVQYYQRFCRIVKEYAGGKK